MLLPAEFDDYAEKIKPHIDAIGDKSHRPRLFRSIEAACKNNDAFLFVDDESFVVLRPIVTDGIKKLLVWVAWSNAGNAIEKYLPEIKRLAKMIDIDQLEFWTSIEAINRYVPRFGWEKQFTVWGMRI